MRQILYVIRSKQSIERWEGKQALPSYKDTSAEIEGLYDGPWLKSLPNEVELPNAAPSPSRGQSSASSVQTTIRKISRMPDELHYLRGEPYRSKNVQEHLQQVRLTCYDVPTMMLLIGMKISFTKNPMKPITVIPTAVWIAILENSAESNSASVKIPQATPP